MSEQLTIDGAPERVGPPWVPPVVFLDAPTRLEVGSRSREKCGHCMINAAHFEQHRGPQQWRDAADVTILRAVCLITQVDGSTLYLCAQHAQEHAERGNLHV